MMHNNNRGLYVISDSNIDDEKVLLEKTETLLRLGISLFQYHNKEHQHDYAKLALGLKDLCEQYQCPFIVNDDVMLAKSIKADGIHLGEHDKKIEESRDFLGPESIIGASCYNRIDLARKAYQTGANYVAMGAFFPSTNKPNAVNAEFDLIKRVKMEIPLPVVAIGGITPQNAKKIVEAEADYIAVISGLYNTDNIEQAHQQYMQNFS